jgi:Sigma-70, region 4
VFECHAGLRHFVLFVEQRDEPYPQKPASEVVSRRRGRAEVSRTQVERAVFLLREVFGYEYAEIAALVGKSEANCRQISRRARQSVAARRPRFESSPQQEERLMEGFLQASLSGDMEALLALLSDDVILYSDGGGKTRAALKPIYGADNVARFLTGILRNIPPGLAVRRTRVNGRPGIVGYFGDGSPQSVVTLEGFTASLSRLSIASGATRQCTSSYHPRKPHPRTADDTNSEPSGSPRRA